MSLYRSLDPGQTEKYVQFATARKIRSTFFTASYSSAVLSTVSAMSYNTTKTYSTNCPTYGYWFDRFIWGCYKRMGDVVVFNYGFPLELFLELSNQLKRDFREAMSVEAKESTMLFANLITFGYLGALRGRRL